MSQRHFSHLGRELRCFGCPILGDGLEAVNRDLILTHATQEHRHRHVREVLVPCGAREHERASLVARHCLYDGQRWL